MCSCSRWRRPPQWNVETKMRILELLGGLASLVILILWIRWLLKPSPSATWPRRDFLRVTLLYFVLFFFVAFTLLGIDAFASSLGASEEFSTYLIGMPMFFMVLIVVTGFLYTWGVPTPPFLVPRWIREQDREHRRIQRAARKQRWQDPEAKKSDIKINIAIPFIVLGAGAVLYLIVFGVASLFT